MSRRSSRTALVAVVVLVASVGAGLAGSAPVVAAPSARAVPTTTTPGAFVGLSPVRVLDTRTGNGAPKAQVRAGAPVHLVVGGRGGVPADAAAAVLTLTVVGSNAGGYLTAYPTGGTRPTASVVNWAPGQTVAGEATVTLGAGGAVDLLVQAAKPVDLVADVAGYTVAGTPTAAGAYVARTPSRLLDTRTGNGLPKAPLRAGQQAYLPVLGRGGIPTSGVSAVVGTLTAVASRSPGYLTVWPDGDRPVVSSVNYAAGQVVANQVTVPLGTAGGFSLFTSGGPVDVVFDVTGYVIAGAATQPGTFVPLPPRRLASSGEVPYQLERRLPVAGDGGVPTTGVGAVVANLTVTHTRSAGYLTAWPTGDARPVASNLNWSNGATVADQATLTLGDTGAVSVFTPASAFLTLYVDVSGYYLPSPPATPTELTASPTRTAVTLTWSASGDQSGFTVRRATGTTAPTAPTEGTAVTVVAAPAADGYTLTDTGLTPGTTYSYGVFADDRVPNHSPPATVTVTTLPPDVTPPGPVTELAASAVTTTSVTLTWTPPVDADYANAVVRETAGTTPPTSPSDGTSVGANRNAVFVAGLASGSTHSFRVFARDNSGNLAATGPAVTVTTLGLADLLGTTVSTPPPGLDPTKAMTGRDCPPAGSCVALASYRDETADRHALLLLSVVGPTGPVSYPVKLPSTAQSLSYVSAAVSCTRDTDCVLVGHYTDVAGDPVAFTGRWNGTRATTTKLSGMSGTVTPDAVDCPTTGTCTAVGQVVTDAGTHPWIARLAAGRWTEVPFAGDAAPEVPALTSVSCATTTSCAATGGPAYPEVGPALLASTTDGTSWSEASATVPTGSTGWWSLGPVTCPAAGRCLAAGRSVLTGSPTRYGAALTSLQDGVWKTEALSATPSTDDADPAQVACGAGTCTVLVGDGSRSTLYTRPLTGGAWTVHDASVLPAGARADLSPGLFGIACDAAGRCVGTGGWTDTTGYSRGFVAVLSSAQNSATSVEPSRRAGLNGDWLDDPVCTDDGHCIATRTYLADTQNGWVASFRIVGGA